jgi:FeS assembly SUF system regulator
VIRLSKLADYGIVMITNMARDPQRQHNAAEIASASHIALPMASKILKALTRAGLLTSYRGAKGGYGLARRPDQISAVEIITALEGPIGLTECTVHPGQCVQEASCHVREPWQRINSVVREALARVTLEELATPEPGAGERIPLAELGVDLGASARDS